MLLNWIIFELLVFLGLLDDIKSRPQLAHNFTPSNNSRGAPENLNKSRERILNIRRKGGITFSDQYEQGIIFPDSGEVIFEPIPKIDGAPKCADGSTFCENFNPYPMYHVQDILRKNPSLYNSFWGKDEVPIDIINRVAGEEERFLCSSIDRTIFPNAAKNKNQKWKYVINQPEGNYKQGIRIETCRSEGNPCDLIGEIPDGYVTSCKQKYVYRRLLAIGEEGSPVVDSFEIPSACCCSYKRNFDFLARFGAPVTPVKKKRT